MDKKLLLDNAYEAWLDATLYAYLIKDGISTLGYKKKFVAALHNAVELFSKQIMIDKCDYRVATIKSGLSKDGLPLKNYFTATDLNKYFMGLGPEEIDRFYSVDFKQIIDICKGENYYGFNIGEAMNLLNNLRNSETHFYINNENYLNENEFKILYNFIVDYFKELSKYHLMPWDYGMSDLYGVDFIFNHDKLEKFCYSSAIKKSKVTKLLSEFVTEYELEYNFNPSDSPIRLTYKIWDKISKYPITYSFERTLAYIESIYAAKIINFKLVEDYLTDEPNDKKVKYYRVTIKTSN